jgi:ATP-dependent Clp protease ATP-binding subunit ClpC
MLLRRWLELLFPPDAKTEPPFTPRMVRLLQLTREIAGEEAPNANHLASAIPKLNEGCAINVLKRLEIAPEQLMPAIAAKAVSVPTIEDLLVTAEAERKQMHHRYLGTEHLLLALVQRSHGVRLLFEEKGIGIAAARQEVLKELDPNFQLSE